jgi:hypothetical protein
MKNSLNNINNKINIKSINLPFIKKYSKTPLNSNKKLIISKINIIKQNLIKRKNNYVFILMTIKLFK